MLVVLAICIIAGDTSAFGRSNERARPGNKVSKTDCQRSLAPLRLMTEHRSNPIEPQVRLEVYRLALAESRSAFEDLMAQPDTIRRNAGALLGFAAVAVTLLGAVPARQPGWAGATCEVGVVVGVVGLVVCTAVLLAPKKLVPSMRADQIVKWGDLGDSEEAAVKSLALGIEKSYQDNQAVIDTMAKWQIAAAICFGMTVIMLAARQLGA